LVDKRGSETNNAKEGKKKEEQGDGESSKGRGGKFKGVRGNPQLPDRAGGQGEVHGRSGKRKSERGRI